MRSFLVPQRIATLAFIASVFIASQAFATFDDSTTGAAKAEVEEDADFPSFCSTGDAAEDARQRERNAKLEKLAARCDDLGMRLEAKLTRLYKFSPFRVPLTPPRVASDADAWRLSWVRRLDGLDEPVSSVVFSDSPVFNGRVKTRWGWLFPDQISRYEDGERFIDGEWTTVEGAERIISSRGAAWTIETPTWVIYWRGDLEEGAVAADLLERFTEFWRYFYRPEHFGRKVPRLKALVFANRNEYIQEISSVDVNAVNSIGGYFPALKMLFAYIGAEDFEATLLHEACHQLFAETSGASTKLGKRPGDGEDFWLVEGTACLAESYRENGNFAYYGGLGSERLKLALEALRNGEFWSITSLRRYSSKEFQNSSDVLDLYAFSALWCSYLSAIDRKRYVEAVWAVYSRGPAKSVRLDSNYFGVETTNASSLKCFFDSLDKIEKNAHSNGNAQ